MLDTILSESGEVKLKEHDQSVMTFYFLTFLITATWIPRVSAIDWILKPDYWNMVFILIKGHTVCITGFMQANKRKIPGLFKDF